MEDGRRRARGKAQVDMDDWVGCFYAAMARLPRCRIHDYRLANSVRVKF